MKRLLRALRRGDRGVAAIEMALAAPIMLAFLGGVVDLGLMAYDDSRIAAGVGAGAEYALLNTSSVMSNGATAQSTTIPNLVKSASGLSSMTVTVTGLSPAACYCVSGTPPAAASATCGSNCTDGSPAGTYVFITASYTYTPMLLSLAHHTISQTATVQIK